MAAMNMVSAGGFSGGKLSFKKISAGGRHCTSQENPHFWVPTIKVRPPDGTHLKAVLTFDNLAGVVTKRKLSRSNVNTTPRTIAQGKCSQIFR